MHQMAKSMKDLKKENAFLKGKCERSDITLVELVEEVGLLSPLYFQPQMTHDLSSNRIHVLPAGAHEETNGEVEKSEREARIFMPNPPSRTEAKFVRQQQLRFSTELIKPVALSMFLSIKD